MVWWKVQRSLNWNVKKDKRNWVDRTTMTATKCAISKNVIFHRHRHRYGHMNTWTRPFRPIYTHTQTPGHLYTFTSSFFMRTPKNTQIHKAFSFLAGKKKTDFDCFALNCSYNVCIQTNVNLQFQSQAAFAHKRNVSKRSAYSKGRTSSNRL